MSHEPISSAGGVCGSYRAGHRVHFIQARKSIEADQPLHDVFVRIRPDGLVELNDDGLETIVWNHEVDRLSRLCVGDVTVGQWRPRFQILSVGGRLFSFVAPDARTSCGPACGAV